VRRSLQKRSNRSCFLVVYDNYKELQDYFSKREKNVMSTTYILDTHGLLYQLFHALPPMNSPKGEPLLHVSAIMAA